MKLDDLIKLNENRLNNLYVLRESLFRLGEIDTLYQVDTEIEEYQVLLASLRTLL